MLFHGLSVGIWGEAGEAVARVSGGRHAAKAMMGFALMDIGGSAVSAPKGHLLSSMGGSIAGQITGNIAALAFGFNPIASLVAGVAGDSIRFPVEKGIQALSELDQKVRSVKMGGDYRDTQMAMTMRQVAARELSGSLLSARQHLGREALLMHQ